MALRHTALQKAADNAALAAAKQVQIGISVDERAATVARSVALSTLGQPDDGTSADNVETSLSANKTMVTVMVTEPVNGPFQNILRLPASVSATATALFNGSVKICVIGLDSTKNETITAKTSASISASQCSIFSNSADPGGLQTTEQGSIKADKLYTSGGFKGSGMVPTPVTDTPRVADPLANVAQPAVGGCDYTSFKATASTSVIYPGVYCQGLELNTGATITISSGLYVVKGGDFHLDGGVTVNGDYVTFFLTGNAKLNFGPNSTLSLSASKTGPLPGFLFFEDRAANPTTHEVGSNAARKLLGTIYLRNGTLHVGSIGSVADVSAYTVIVADQVRVDQSAVLTLNVNYGATDVPVPDGVGQVSGKTYLAR